MFYIDSLIMITIRNILSASKTIDNFSLTRGIACSDSGEMKRYIRIEINNIRFKLISKDYDLIDEYILVSVEGKNSTEIDHMQIFSNIIEKQESITDRLEDYESFVSNIIDKYDDCDDGCPCMLCDDTECLTDVCFNCVTGQNINGIKETYSEESRKEQKYRYTIVTGSAKYSVPSRLKSILINKANDDDDQHTIKMIMRIIGDTSTDYD